MTEKEIAVEIRRLREEKAGLAFLRTVRRLSGKVSREVFVEALRHMRKVGVERGFTAAPPDSGHAPPDIDS